MYTTLKEKKKDFDTLHGKKKFRLETMVKHKVRMGIQLLSNGDVDLYLP